MKGFLPQGASTKRWFCFGSPTEIFDDLVLNEKEVILIAISSWDGLKLLRKNIGDKNIINAMWISELFFK